MPTTILDVARKAGVATGTASEIINSGHIHKFSKKTVAKVRQAAVDIGYTVNRSAQALRTQRTGQIGIAVYGDNILGVFNQPYVAAVYQGIGDFFGSREYKLIFENYSPERGFKHLADLGNSGSVDGIIFVMLAPQIRMLMRGDADFLNTLRLPLVIVHSLGTRSMAHPNVGADMHAGVRKALDHFADVHGYRTVGFVGSGHSDTHIAELEAAFNRIVREKGLEVRPEWMFEAAYGTAAGVALVEDAVRQGLEWPRALLAADTSIADGMVHGLREHGIRVPEDVAIIGFGEIVDEFYHMHGLTCIDQKPKRKGQAAAAMLLDLLDHEPHEKTVTMEPELNIRTSCGCGKSAQERTA